MQPGRRKEERHDESVRRASHAGQDVGTHPVRQTGHGGAQHQRADCDKAVVKPADGRRHEQQGQRLRDADGGEHAEPGKLLEQALAGQHPGHDADARQRQNAGERQRRVEVQPQGEPGAGQIRCDQQCRQHRDADRHSRRGEIPAAGCRDEAGHVDLVETHDEEEDDGAGAQEERDRPGRLHDSGQRSQQSAGQRTGDGGVQAEAAEDPLGDLGSDD